MIRGCLIAHNYKLSEEIVALSVADRWDEARLEWRIDDIYWEEEPDTCLCGHFPINELCYLRNVKNNARTLVGNVCVKKFMGLPSDQMFAAIKRIALDDSRALNPEAITHAHSKGWINEWERKFYFSTWRTRRLSGRQLAKRIQINQLVLGRIRNAR
jgi:hypothetical protein